MPFESVAQQHFLEAHPEKVGGRAALKEWDPDARRKFTYAQGEVDKRGGNDIDYTNLMQNTDREEESQILNQSGIGSPWVDAAKKRADAGTQ